MSLGISLYPSDGEDGDTLLKHADTAMYEAKAQGRNRFCFYTREMSARAVARMSLDNRLRRALQDDALELHYQPKLDLESGEIAGVEALVRWPQADGDLLGPDAFLDIAEDTGQIVPIGLWVLETATRQAASWPEALAGLDLSINLSPSQLADERLFERLEELFSGAERLAVPLVLEITEEALMAERESGRIDRLRQLGLRISIDNFGTGFTSLGVLQSLPIDELKIDGSFVASLGTGPRASIPRTILAMAEGLGLEVVAEGVETDEQLRVLRKEGCHRAQGFLVAPPMPWSELEAHLCSKKPPWAGLVRRRRGGKRQSEKEGEPEGGRRPSRAKSSSAKSASGSHLRIVE